MNSGFPSLRVRGEVFHWRGPAPYHFVAIPAHDVPVLQDAAAEVSYGWGMVPVDVTLGDVTWSTSLWPREGGYVVPIKDAPRRAAAVELGDVVDLIVTVAPRS